jgi:hypothetical protein
LVSSGRRKSRSPPEATSRRQDGFLNFEATALTSLLLAIPSETEIFRLWPMALANDLRDFPSGTFPIAPQIEITFVYRGDFDGGREVVGVTEHEAAEPLVLLKIARHNDKARTNLPRSSSWHFGVDAELAGS